AIGQLAPDGTRLLTGKPRLLGFIPQGFRVYGGAMTARAAYYRGEIESHLHSDVISILRTIDTSLAPAQVSGLSLGQVQNFGTLVQQAQQQKLPLFEISGSNSYLVGEANREF